MTILCAYLDGDITRLRTSFILGSLIPLGALLVWISIALSLSAQTDQSVDPVELLMRAETLLYTLADAAVVVEPTAPQKNAGCLLLAITLVIDKESLIISSV
ncbi:hypothetical protein ACFE04_028182 [Oxalis oulophora]